MKSLSEIIKNAIDELPKSANEIAKLFEYKLIKGHRNCVFDCPINTYLQIAFTDYDTIYYVNEHCVFIFENEKMSKLNTRILYNFPSHVTEFIRNFDNGLYPNIEW